MLLWSIVSFLLPDETIRQAWRLGSTNYLSHRRAGCASKSNEIAATVVFRIRETGFAHEALSSFS
jgi:hypothetical protein